MVLDDTTEHPFDLCVWAGGFSVPALARDCGLDVDASGRVPVDHTMRSVSHPDAYAIGDAAAVSGSWGDSLAMGCRTGGFTGPFAADAIASRVAGIEPNDFHFRYLHECISLGRRHGLVQFLNADQSPKNHILTGRMAIGYKNATLNGATVLFRWPGPCPARRRHVAELGAAQVCGPASCPRHRRRPSGTRRRLSVGRRAARPIASCRIARAT